MSEPNEQQTIAETQHEGDLQVKSNINAGNGPSIPEPKEANNGIAEIGGIFIDSHNK